MSPDPGHGTQNRDTAPGRPRRQRQADNERRLRLEQQGYRVLEFTYEDVTQRPDYLIDTIVARLAVPH